MSEGEFIEDAKTQDSVLYRLSIVGEAVKDLPDELKDGCDYEDWKSVAGFRDVAIHQYHSMRMARVWNIVTVHMPKLKRAISELRESL